MRMYWRIIIVAIAISITGLGWAEAGEDGKMSVADLEKAMAKCENAITQATEKHQQGKIAKGKPLSFRIFPKYIMGVSEENFDADIEKMWNMYYKILAARKKALASTRPSHVEASRKEKKPLSRIEAMRREEKKSASASPDPQVTGALNFDIYDDYQASRQQRISAENQAAEADIRSVIAERQAADVDAQQRLARKGQLQAQASMWQAELDKQATGSAKAAAAWNAEHSATGYAKKFLGTVIQTTVGAFTGGLFGTLGYNAANKAVEQIFPNQSRSSSRQAPGQGGANRAAPVGGAQSGSPQY